MLKHLPFVLLAACGTLQDYGGPVPPLATIDIQLDSSDLAQASSTRVALVWGMQWLPEAFCILPAENADAQTMKDRGCRDPFGFVPLRVEADAQLDATGAAQIQLFDVPGADVLVGDVTARVAYGSLVAYQDTNNDNTLTIVKPARLFNGDMMGPPDKTPTTPQDLVLDGSFSSMIASDSRLAYREGVFVQTAFYPRAGCGDPLPGFSIDAASGFDANTAAVDAAAGMLPPETDPNACSQEAPPGPAPIAIKFATGTGAPSFPELACTERDVDSSVRYLEPEQDTPPDLTDRVSACVHLPSFSGPSSTIELLVSGKSTDACVEINHYVLTGCREDPNCGSPDWDHSGGPPTWWPCPLQ